MRVGINGFGRIGRQVLKIIYQRYSDELEVGAINSMRTPSALAHLLKYDSTYGRYNGAVESDQDSIIISGKRVKVLSGSEPSQIPWANCGIDIVIESTGQYIERSKASGHLKKGARKVIITAISPDADITIIPGINEEQYNPVTHSIISAASCTTNCIAPVAKVLLEDFGIQRGFLTTIHAYTMNQVILDRWHRDWRRGRAAGINIIPTTTGAAVALARVIPELKGKIDGLALRVPAQASLIDFVADLNKEVTVEQINQTFQAAAEGSLHGILEFCSEPLVSSDFIGNPASAIVDGLSTMVIGGNTVKVIAWYDNEWGYSSRIVDLISYIARDKGYSRFLPIGGKRQ